MDFSKTRNWEPGKNKIVVINWELLLNVPVPRWTSALDELLGYILNQTS